MDDETWKEIPGYEGCYMVSNRGRVRSLVGRWGTGRVLKPRVDKDGYNVLVLTKRGVQRYIRISRMMALAFFGKPNGLYVCHNNGINSDDRLENLRYDTAKGNCRDRLRHGTHRYGEKHHEAKLTEDRVRQIQSDPRPLKEIAAEHGITMTLVSYIQRGKSWGHIANPRQTRTLSHCPKTGRFVSV